MLAQLGRTWLGLAAVGAGLIHLAVAASSAPALLAVFLVIGAAEVVWGVAAMSVSRLPLPRVTIAGALLPIAVWVVALLSAPRMAMSMSGSSTMSTTLPLPTGAMLGASALDLVIAIGVALTIRAAVRRVPATVHPFAAQPWRYLLGVLVGAALVAVVTANSLAATPVGAAAMPGMR